MKTTLIISLLLIISGVSAHAGTMGADSCKTVSYPSEQSKSDSIKFVMLHLPQDYSPPKEAVFCRFENTMKNKFGIGVKLRVGQPDLH